MLNKEQGTRRNKADVVKELDVQLELRDGVYVHYVSSFGCLVLSQEPWEKGFGFSLYSST